VTLTHQQIAERAYFLWEERGRPVGSPEIDWLRAERELRNRLCRPLPHTAGTWARPVRSGRLGTRPQGS
jgi:hypothetical protein